MSSDRARAGCRDAVRTVRRRRGRTLRRARRIVSRHGNALNAAIDCRTRRARTAVRNGERCVVGAVPVKILEDAAR